MADIAMLVAEEYERRVKVSAAGNRVGADQNQEIHLVASLAVLAQKMKSKIGQERIEVVKLALEPRSQIGVAAFNGTFSA